MQVQPEPVLKDEHALAGLRMNAGAAGEGEGNQHALHVRYSKRAQLIVCAGSMFGLPLRARWKGCLLGLRKFHVFCDE
jgi:hypothetical protein